MGLVLRAPGMVSATDMTVMLLSSWSTVKLLPEVKVTVLGSQGSSRKALSLNLQQPSQTAQGQHLCHCQTRFMAHQHWDIGARRHDALAPAYVETSQQPSDAQL